MHVFGDHSKCGDWCGFLKQPESYKPRNLPYGKYLTGESLLLDLQKVFQTFANNVDKHLKIGSTQSNESFNNKGACTNSKSRFYAGSESTAFTVAVAVTQKNIGQEALLKVYDNLLLVPWKEHQIRYHQGSKEERIQQRSERKCNVQETSTLKSTMTKDVSTAEIKEGATYQSGVDNSQSVEEIPDVTVPPIPAAVNTDHSTFLNLTWKPLAWMACVFEEETFNRYVMPTIEITPGATSVTGICLVNGEMFHHKTKVDCVSIKRCLLDFTEWIQQFKNPLLVCHNEKAFDSIVLIKACLNAGNISIPVKGFVDSLTVVREILTTFIIMSGFRSGE